MSVAGIVTGGLLVSPSKIITNGLFSSSVVALPPGKIWKPGVRSSTWKPGARSTVFEPARRGTVFKRY